MRIERVDSPLNSVVVFGAGGLPTEWALCRGCEHPMMRRVFGLSGQMGTSPREPSAVTRKRFKAICAGLCS
jgi:hypothetical protein